MGGGMAAEGVKGGEIQDSLVGNELDFSRDLFPKQSCQ